MATWNIYGGRTWEGTRVDLERDPGHPAAPGRRPGGGPGGRPRPGPQLRDRPARLLGEALGMEWRYAPALLGTPGSPEGWQAPAPGADDPGGTAYGIALLSRLPLEVETALLPQSGRDEPASPCWPGWPTAPADVAGTHLSFVPGPSVTPLEPSSATWTSGAAPPAPGRPQPVVAGRAAARSPAGGRWSAAAPSAAPRGRWPPSSSSTTSSPPGPGPPCGPRQPDRQRPRLRPPGRGRRAGVALRWAKRQRRWSPSAPRSWRRCATGSCPSGRDRWSPSTWWPPATAAAWPTAGRTRGRWWWRPAPATPWPATPAPSTRRPPRPGRGVRRDADRVRKPLLAAATRSSTSGRGSSSPSRTRWTASALGRPPNSGGSAGGRRVVRELGRRDRLDRQQLGRSRRPGGQRDRLGAFAEGGWWPSPARSSWARSTRTWAWPPSRGSRGSGSAPAPAPSCAGRAPPERI